MKLTILAITLLSTVNAAPAAAPAAVNCDALSKAINSAAADVKLYASMRNVPQRDAAQKKLDAATTKYAYWCVATDPCADTQVTCKNGNGLVKKCVAFGSSCDNGQTPSTKTFFYVKETTVDGAVRCCAGTNIDIACNVCTAKAKTEWDSTSNSKKQVYGGNCPLGYWATEMPCS